MGPGLAQPALFYMLRRREAWHLTRHGAVAWSPDTGRSSILTSVVRVPVSLGMRVRELVLPAAGDTFDEHYVYPAADMHVTIANLDRYAGIPAPRLKRVLAGCLAEAPPFSFDLRGLAISRNTVYVQVYARPTRAFYSLRASLLRRLEPGGPPRLPRPADIMAFSNVVRFRAGDVTAAAAITVRHGRDFFGSFPVEAVDLVATDKVLSKDGTVVIATCTRNHRPEEPVD